MAGAKDKIRPIAWITGAGSGIGLALAREYARRGWDLALVSRRPGPLQDLAEELRLRYPEQRFFIRAIDLMDVPQQQTGLEELVRETGIPNLFLANAGFGHSMDPRRPMWENTYRTVMTNLTGTLTGIEFCKELWIRQRLPGHLAIIGSVAGARGLPGSAAYSCAKAALEFYCESVRAPLALCGIRVTVIFPGFVRTAMISRRSFRPWLLEPEAAARRIAGAIEQGRARYVFPFPMRLIFPILRHMPDFLFDRIQHRIAQQNPFHYE